MTTPAPAGGNPNARVVVLAGPSGAGKSRLAARLRDAHGWPVVRLDDFYRDEDHLGMPRSAGLGIVDWDHPDSWDGAAAVGALQRLVLTGEAEVPVYDLARNRSVGAEELRARVTDLVLAEGIFAAETVPGLRHLGLLHSAWCVHQPRLLTFGWRLLRDLKERRKPPMVLLRRGLLLMRRQGEVIRRQQELGARAARPREVERQLSGAAAVRRPPRTGARQAPGAAQVDISDTPLQQP